MRRKTKTSEEKKKMPKKDVNKTVTLPKETVLEMRINHLEMDKLKANLSRLGSEIKNYEKSALLARLDMRDVRGKISILEKQHEDFLDQIKLDFGVDVRNKTINPHTYEVV